MEKYICSKIVQHEIYMYCDSRQSKRNPCKRCKFRIPKKFNYIDCIFRIRVKDWNENFDFSFVRTNIMDSE